MRALIHRIIELLKRRVKDNLEKINQNQSEIKELLKKPFSAERTYYIEKNYAANKVLLTDNNELISLQLALLKFLEKYKDSPEFDSTINQLNSEVSDDDDAIFEKTIQGKLIFDLMHPKFDNEEFFNKLLSYFAAIEAYEKCADLLQLKKLAG
jgi:hypothetical protein